jgi:molecular chaperone HscB
VKTHFDVFGLPLHYGLDSGLLEQRYRELSLKRHPDRVTGQDPKERRLALEETTALNEAYKTLKDPVRRAFYALKLHGVDLDREDAGAHQDMPLEFLEEVISLREELDEAKKAKDLGKARAMAKDVDARREDALGTAVRALGQLELEPGDSGALRDASRALARVRYFLRFLDEVESLEEEAL